MSETLSQGRIQVEHNQIRVLAEPQDLPPTLIVARHPSLHVLVDGVEVVGRVQVHAFQEIQVSVIDVEPYREIRIQVSPDTLHATLEIEYQKGQHFRLGDSPPTAVCLLHVIQEAVLPQPYTRSDVRQLLAEQRIVEGVDWEAIDSLLASGESGSCVCASGTPPVDGLPERVTILVQPVHEPLYGIVPVRPILSVQKGVSVAKRLPEESGEAGVSVYGTAIPPYTPPAKLPRIGDGLAENDEGFFISVRGGRVIHRPDLLDVAPTLEFNESLTAKQGHVQFDGDVLVRGNVEQGVEIAASGQVFVQGIVSRAKIVGDAGIFVSGGVFQSELYAGLRYHCLQELYHVLQDFLQEWKIFQSDVERLQEAVKTRGSEISHARIVGSLLADKYREILVWPTRFQEFIESHPTLDLGPWLGRLRQAGEWMRQAYLESTTIQRWVLHRTEVEKWLSVIENWEVSAELAAIQCAYAQSSDLRAAGDVDITHQGVYQCRVRAGGTVKALGKPGVILGSNIEAGLAVFAKIIGSHAESITRIHLRQEDGCQVSADLVYPGTIFIVDDFPHHVQHEWRQCVWPVPATKDS